MMQGQPPSLDDCSSSCDGCSGSFDDCRGSSDDCNGSRDDCNGSCDGGNGSTNQDKPDRPSRPTLQEMLQWLKANRKGMVLPVASMLILAAVLGFASVYEFGGASGMAGSFLKAQEEVLAVASPLGFGLIAGFAAAAMFEAEPRPVFWVNSFIFLMVHISLFWRFEALRPIWVWCRGALPNIPGIGLALASAGIATWVRELIWKTYRDERRFISLMRQFALWALVVAAGCVLVLRPFLTLDMAVAPVVLDPRLNLAWQYELKDERAGTLLGMWFPSREAGRGQPGYSKDFGFIENSPVSIGEDGLIITSSQIARISLAEGNEVWHRRHDFKIPSQIPSPTCEIDVVFQRDNVYLLAYKNLFDPERAPTLDAYGFNWEDGTPIWEKAGIKLQPFAYRDQAKAAVLPGYLAVVIESREPQYMVLNLQTGDSTVYALPIPEGMQVPVRSYPTRPVGPWVYQSPGGAGIQVFYVRSDMEYVPDGWTEDPLPGVACLYGLDPDTGKVAWEIWGAGDWRDSGEYWFGHEGVTRYGYQSGLLQRFDISSQVFQTGTPDNPVSPRWLAEFPQFATYVLSDGRFTWLSQDGYCSSLDAVTGERVWRVGNPEFGKAAHPRLVVFEGRVAVMMKEYGAILDLENGECLGEYRVPAGLFPQIRSVRFRPSAEPKAGLKAESIVAPMAEPMGEPMAEPVSELMLDVASYGSSGREGVDLRYCHLLNLATGANYPLTEPDRFASWQYRQHEYLLYLTKADYDGIMFSEDLFSESKSSQNDPSQKKPAKTTSSGSTVTGDMLSGHQDNASPPSVLKGVVPVLKVNGQILERPFEVTDEGWILVSCFDAKAKVHRLYMLSPAR